MSALEKLAEIEKARTEYETRLNKESKAIVGEIFKEFFEANPTIRAVHWTQNTPGFNDGDPCYFGVNDFYYALKSEASEYEELAHGGDEEGWHYGYGSDTALESKATSDLYKTLPERVLEVAFGDGYSIIATPDGFTTEEYGDY